MRNIKNWACDNKESLIVAVSTAIIGVATTLVKTFVTQNKKGNKIYDPKLGFYWELRRSISNEERRAIEKKRKNGEALGDILEEMRLLK